MTILVFVDLFDLLRGWKVYENIWECREKCGDIAEAYPNLS